MLHRRLVFLPVLLLLVSLASHVSAAEWFISPAGSDANPGTEAQPFRTFAKAFATMSGGDSLLLLDGLYTAATTGIIHWNAGASSSNAIPSGTAAARTRVAARNRFGATIDGDLFVGRSTRKDSYITFEGIIFRGRGFLFNTSHDTLKYCFFGRGLSIGTRDHNQGNDYNLVEDCVVRAAQERVVAINYRAHYNVWRRVLIRGDGCNTTDCTTGPNVGFTVYSSQHVSVQNVLVLDRVLGGGNPYGDFATAQHALNSTTPDFPLLDNQWLGCVSLNSEDSGFHMEADSAQAPSHVLSDVVVAGQQARTSINLGGDKSSVVERATVVLTGPQAHSMIRRYDNTVSPTTRKSIYRGTAQYGVVRGGATSDMNCFGTYANGCYYSTTVTGVDLRSDPFLNGLLHPVRIEEGSVLAGYSIGANVLQRIGADGTRHGETGFDTPTSACLWPWPEEARAKQFLCEDAGVTRGLCQAQSITKYVWEYFGNAAPASYCGTSGCMTANWQNEPFAAQSGTFVAEADVTPSGSSVDVGVSLSDGPRSAWSGLAVTVLFHPDGTVKAIDGSSYRSSTIAYTANATYRVRFEVNVPAHTYSAFVGGQPVGTNLAFRTGQGTAAKLDQWTLSIDAGSATVCNRTIESGPTETERVFQNGTDTWINFYDSNLNFNGDTKLLVLGGGNAKSLAAFDLSSIPANATVLSATLALYNYGHEASINAGQITVARVTKPWVETQATWNVYASGSAWSAPGMQAGTDWVMASEVTISIDTASGVWRTWDVRAIVQNWVSGAAPNRGFVVRSGTLGVKPRFYSNAYTGDASLRPKLTVRYSTP